MALHCPAGHGPFEDWADHCPTCGAVLVGREPIVHLATAPNQAVAAMWAELLGRQGIRTMVKPLGPGFGALGTNAPLEHVLYVLAPDLQRARRILAEPTDRRGRSRTLPRPRPRRQPKARRPMRSRSTDS